MTCPGSVVLSDGMPERSSEFADEGIQAHALAEAWLRGEMFEAPRDMRDHVAAYVNHVRVLGGKLHIEQRVTVNNEIYGTADAVVWQAEHKHLHVVDLKYGAGVPVEVRDNLQLKIYALAALVTFQFPARTITATIVQPRCPHADGPVRSVAFDAIDLLDFHADLLDAAKRVERAGKSPRVVEEFLRPGEKACRWCLAAPKCPALKSKAQTLAKQVFAPGLAYDPRALAETLDMLPILEAWIKNTREFAYQEASKGVEVPDWKLVEKRATRKWRDDGQVAQALSPYVETDSLYERKLLTPAAVEKLLPKDQRSILADLTVAESSGHTLVHTSDKRPAVKVDAKSAFANS